MKYALINSLRILAKLPKSHSYLAISALDQS
jgi:hypothetical protein